MKFNETQQQKLTVYRNRRCVDKHNKHKMVVVILMVNLVDENI